MCVGTLWHSAPPDVPASSNAGCSFGLQVPPHLLSSCWHTEWVREGRGLFFFCTSQRILGVCSAIWLYTFVCSDSQTWFNSQFLARDLSPGKMTKDKQAQATTESAAADTVDESGNIIIFLIKIEKLCKMFSHSFLLHFTSLDHLQPSCSSKARRITVNQDDNVLVCMPSANYWVNHSFSAQRGKCY